MVLTSPPAGLFGRPRRSFGFLRLTLIAICVFVALLYLKAAGTSADDRARYMAKVPSVPKMPEMISKWKGDKQEQTQLSSAAIKIGPHPIDKLMANAVDVFDNMMNSQTYDLASTAAAYRRKRGRHPPPGFDAWFKFASDNNAIFVEEFFDQIYHDLGPFWGQPANLIRRSAWDYEMTINVRDGKASAGSDWFWTQIWLNMTQEIEHLLPDMDIALNAMDEPRLVAPWEEINKLMEVERKSRRMLKPVDMKTEFNKLPVPGKGDLDVVLPGMNWEKTARGCPPDSLSRNVPVLKDFNHRPNVSPKLSEPHTFQGYVSNFSLSVDYCHQPDLQSLHGAFIEPLTVSASKTLMPMFGGSKLPTNNEILLPAPMYWANEERFSGGDDHGAPWAEKQTKAIWRGVATGGQNDAKNWKGFQRHRFVAMINATQAGGAQAGHFQPEDWTLPDSSYNVKAQKNGDLGAWVDSWSDAAFVDLNCFPQGQCDYVDPYFSTRPGLSMATQFSSKYLPDIDGNSFSGRYRGFLMSSSLPIKATIFKEWHDSRLVPWRHFVPMDNRFMDFYGIMEYFVGYKGGKDGEGKVEGHDAEAKRIAEDGQGWANKVLRKEDMLIYVLRLLLEYARVSSDERGNMGYVDDLLHKARPN